MSARIHHLQRIEFEARIVVSFALVALVLGAVWLAFPHEPPTAVLLGRAVGAERLAAHRAGFVAAAALVAAATLLRMAAGSALTARRVMAFRVQSDALAVHGPYRLCRNPIYLADWTAFVGFALVLPPIGLLLPGLLLLHYGQIIRHEERALATSFGERYRAFVAEAPRFFPTGHSLRTLPAALRELELTRDGVRHNALYVLFLPGLLVAASTGHFWHAVVIGLPATVDWTIVHTRLGRAPGRAERDGKSPAIFDDVLYAHCWEDPEIDRAAFRIGPDDVVLCITSGGCNALAFLLDDPKRVIALDLNPSQNHLLELKRAAIRELDHAALLAFLGAAPSPDRLVTWRRLRRHLPAASRAFWDRRQASLRAGVLRTGRFERYLALIRTWLVRVLGREVVERLATTEDRDARRRLYDRCWDRPGWRLLTDVLLSRRVMTRRFDGAFFAQVDEDRPFGRVFRERIEHALTELPVTSNPFLTWCLLGRYPSARSLPVYLRPEHHETIRGRLERIEVVTASCLEVLRGREDDSVSKFNFTNIFEWIAPDAYEDLLRETVRVATDGAVLTYRNLLVPRSRPPSLAGVVHPRPRLAAALHESDLSFLYGSYVVETVRKAGVPCGA